MPLPPANDDIAIRNLRASERLPGLEGITPERCLKTLDEWASRVASETSRVMYMYRRGPSRYWNCLARFRMMVLVTVLQRDLGVHYRQELIDMPDEQFFKDAKNLFIHGVVVGHGGTCSSLPPAFIAVGRRLGYPLKLVAASRHLFARWDEPDGPRFNVECTSRGFVSNPDGHYLEWPKRMTPEEAARWGLLRSLSPAGESAAFRAARGHCLDSNGSLSGAVVAYADAADLDPEAPAHLECFWSAARRCRDEQRKRVPVGFPPVMVRPSRERFPLLDRRAASELGYLTVRELMLNDPEAERRWWGPLRRDPTLRPPHIPALIRADFHGPANHLKLTFHDTLPPDYDPTKAYPA